MKLIEQEVIIPAKPAEVYNAFMDEDIHSAFTGDHATIDKTVGGNFKVSDGYATGVNKELVPGEKIVQSWHASDWPAGVESEITLRLFPDEYGTKLKFTHKNVPDSEVDEIAKGWQEYYWEPLKKYFKAREG